MKNSPKTTNSPAYRFFMLMLLAGFIACIHVSNAFSQVVVTPVVTPVVTANVNPVVNTAVNAVVVPSVNPVVNVSPEVNVNVYNDRTEGNWFATIKNNKIDIEFRSDDDENNSWSSSSDFPLSEFPNLPKGEKGEFLLKREAGSVLFTGKFDGDQGYGHYKFTEDKEFIDFIKTHFTYGAQDRDAFTFFMINLTKSRAEMLEKNGYKDVSRGNLIAMAALKIDEPFIRSLRESGYNDIPAGQLIAMKSMGIDGAFVKKFADAGYKDIPTGELVTLKSLNITPAYIKSFEAVGYKDINIHSLIPLKSLNITPEYINGFKKLGFTDIPLNELPALKSTGVTPEYVASMQEKGFKSTDLRRYMRLKSSFNE